MAKHSGKTYSNGEVSLRAPNNQAAESSNEGNLEDLEWREWRDRAETQDDIYYFAIHLSDALVGEIFLHDMNLDSGEALIGYRIFSESNRSKGIGRQALLLLQDFAAHELTLMRLVIITGEENIPSRRMAERCGFGLIGSAREDPHLVVYEWKSSEAN